MPRLLNTVMDLRLIAASSLLCTMPLVQAHQHSDNPYLAHVRDDTVPRQQLFARGLSTSFDTSRLYTRFLTPFSPRAAVAASGNDPALYGQWSDSFGWPFVAVHAALLPTGKVLTYESVGNHAAESYTNHDFTRASVWDPNNGSFSQVNVGSYNLFCSGLLSMPDGQVFVAGGNRDSNLSGLDKTHIFDPWNMRWTRGPDMSQGGRWYPSPTTLANGEILITGGGPTVPEIRGTDGSLRPLTGASRSLPLYPWMIPAANGKVTYFGPDQTMLSLTTSGAGSWDSAGQRDNINRDYGSYALFDNGKVLVAGGGGSTDTAMIVDINSQQAVNTQPMHYGRRQHNLTLLADGTVLATGGNSTGTKLVDLNGAVYAAELWNPASGEWTVMNRMQYTRQYHSVALLLPDARVLSAGGGVCDVCTNVGYINENAEIFSPPYLFKKDGSGQLADRPQITGVAEVISYNLNFDLTSPDANRIGKLGLVGLSAVTHSTNFQQRYIPLTYTTGSGVIHFKTPANANLAQPGYYLLFAIDKDGVPSQGRFVRLDLVAPPDNHAPTISGPSNQATRVGSDVNLSLNASDPDSDHLSFAASNLPPGLSINADTGQITGRPTDAGSYYVDLSVTDNHGGLATGGFLWLTTQEAPPPPFGNGLVYEYYEGVSQWPQFDTLALSKTGVMRNFNLGPREREDQFAMRFRAKLNIPADGTYTFYLKSANTSKLYIDGTLVTRNKSPFAVRERSGSITLTAGNHEIVAAYLANGGPPVLRICFEGPGYAKRTIPAAWLQQPSNGLAYEYYEGSWNSLPDFARLSPTRVGFTSVLDLSPRKRNTDYALQFRGKVRVNKTGMYTFFLRSRQGSQLTIDGNAVLGEDRAASDRERSAKVRLVRGDHDFALGYFQTSGPGHLELTYRGPRLPKQALGINALSNN